MENKTGKNARYTILVCDNSQKVLDTVNRFLKAAGYNVANAHSGRNALETIQSPGKKIDLIVTELEIPGSITGIDVLKAAGINFIPVILTSSGIIPEETINELGEISYNFMEICKKPLDFYRLLDLIKKKLP
jgi:DNA-binding NtrC family response regulator